MGSPPLNSDLTFPPLNAAGGLNPGNNTQVQVDPISAEVAAAKDMTEQAEAKQKKKQERNKEALETLKSAIIISGIIVAVAGAAFAITKKLREK